MTTHVRIARLALLAGACLPLSAATALADNKFWNNASGGDFGVATNWLGGAPGPADTAIFNLNAIYTVSVPVAPQNDTLIVRNGHPTLHLSGVPGYIVTDEALIGDQGGFTCQLTILNGRLESGAAFVARDPFTNATLNVSGPGAEWVVNTLASVGRGGVGTVNITGGATATLSGNTFVGQITSAALGTVRVAGEGSTATFNGALGCGDVGKGVVRVESGADVSAISADFGIGFTGTGGLEVDGAGSTFSSSDPTLIGTNGFGELSITSGGAVFSNQGIMGAFTNSSGEGVISGTNSRWVSNGTLQIGRDGAGALLIENGGRVEVIGNAFLGALLNGEGELTINGPNSLLQASQQFAVGREGPGTLTVTGGGSVTSTGAGSPSLAAGIIGGLATSVGEALLSGADSRWTMTNGSMSVGFLGSGELIIQDGAFVTSPLGFIGRSTGSSGVVDIIGADSHWTNDGALGVGVDPSGVDSGSGDLRLHDGGRVGATTITIGALGALRGDGDADADVVNRGVVEPGAPTGVLAVDGTYTQTSAGEFRVSFVPSESVAHGSLVATGAATLGGTIRILVDEEYEPPSGNYTVLTAASRTGVFTTVVPPEEPGVLTYTVQYTANSVIVKIAGGFECPGDTNGDNVVDFADFSQVLSQYGMTGPGLDGDLNGDGVVDFTDLSEVLANYGTTCTP